MDISFLTGETLSNVQKVGDDELVFTLENGDQYKLFHDQDCCEYVVIEDICGDLGDLVGAPLLLVEESSSNVCPPGSAECDDSNTWTFYKFRTIKGSVDVRWHGSSNGYYSEAVHFTKV